MNKRIRELAEQAEEVVFYSPGTGRETKQFNKEKFAKLIIQECLAECSEFESWYNATPKQISDNIKKHFGVEE